MLRDLRQPDTHTANCVPAKSTLESQLMVCVEPEGKLLIGIDTKFMHSGMQQAKQAGYPEEWGAEAAMTQTWRDSLAALIRFADLAAGKEKYGGAIHGDPKRSLRTTIYIYGCTGEEWRSDGEIHWHRRYPSCLVWTTR